jgi:hypothetical protein
MCRCGIRLTVDGPSARCGACGTGYTLHEDVLRFA